MSTSLPQTDQQSKRSKVKSVPTLQAGPSIEELKEEEMYDADVEVVGPDEYEEADSDEEILDHSRKSSQSEAESDWQRDVLHSLNNLDCDSGTSGSSRPSSSGNKRKREDDLTFFRNKHLRSRSPTPNVEIEEIASDEPATILKVVQSLRNRPRSVRKPQTRLRNTSGTSSGDFFAARGLINQSEVPPRIGVSERDDVHMDVD